MPGRNGQQAMLALWPERSQRRTRTYEKHKEQGASTPRSSQASYCFYFSISATSPPVGLPRRWPIAGEP